MQHTRILRDRVAGQSAMSAVMDAQRSAPHRNAFARALGVSPLTAQSRHSYRSALGELVVGDALENLGPTWDVLHDLPLGDSVLDHLLIGRAGVFAVCTVNFGRVDVTVEGDSLAVGGDQHAEIVAAEAQAAEAAQWLAKALGNPVKVRALLVVVEPRRLTVRAPSPSARVVSSRDLARLVSRAPRTLTGEEVARISDVADVESTWPGCPADALDTQQLHRDFNTLRAEVGDALARRIFWAAAATIGVYASVCAIIATFVSVVINY